MKNKIKKIIEDICGKQDFNFNTSLSMDLSLDSLSFIRVISEIENEFNINFDDEDLDIDKIDSINKISKIIEKKL